MTKEIISGSNRIRFDKIMHKDSNETIDGYKVIESMRTSNVAENYINDLSFRNTVITKGTIPDLNGKEAYSLIYFLDKDGPIDHPYTGRLAGIEYRAPGSDHAENFRFVCCNFNSLSGLSESALTVGFDDDRIAYATAPSTDDTRTNNTDIVTRDFIPKDTRIVHTTGDETISGIKTINDYLSFVDGKTLVDGTPTTHIEGHMGNNDYYQIRSGATGNDLGFLEIITGDNGDEPIYFKQYKNSNSTYRTLTLMDASGNSIFPGTITATTVADNDNTTKVATTAWVQKFCDTTKKYLTSHQSLAAYAPLASPAFSGTPTAPTAAVATNNTQIATTAFVKAQGYLTSHQSLTAYAKLASPALTGTPTAPTAAASTNNTQIATTAFVKSQGYLTSHQSLSNYVTLNSAQTISGAKTFSGITTFTGSLIGINKNDLTENANDLYVTSSGVKNIYYTTTNGSTKLTNVPAAVNTILESRTIRYLSSSDWVVEQICHNSNGLYRRTGVSGTWGAWKTFAFTDSNITGNAANVTGTVAIANGGTGATTRLNALKALTNENVSTNATYFLTITSSWGKGGYTSVADAKTVLGLKSAAYTESSAYATSDHTHSQYLTAHQSLANYLTKTTNVSEMGRYIDMHYDNATSKYDYDVRLQINSQGTAAGGGVIQIVAASVKASKFEGPVTGNVTGNCSGSSGSCTGNAATATKINTAPAGTTYVAAVKSANALVSSTTTGFGAIWNAPTKNYRVGCATYPSSNDQILWYSVTNANVTAGTNTVAKSMNWDAGTGILTATGFSGPLTGNASTATKLATARSLNIQDSSATNTGTAASFDGSGNATIKLPATIKANITGNASGSSGSCTGNAATATKLKTARTLWGQSFNGTANVTGTIKTDEVRAGSNSDEIAIYGSTAAIYGSCAKFHGISANTYDPGGTSRKGSIEIMAGTDSTYKCIDFTAGSAWFECSILPNGTQALGHKDYRWNTIYLNNSPNVSSDRRIKSFIGPIPDNVLDTWENIEWKQFKLNDAIEEKGEDAARFHTGLIVQDIKEAFEADELDPGKYGLYCYDTHEERKECIDENGRVICTYRPAGNQYSLRYTEALCMEAAYTRRKIKTLEEENESLKKRIEILEKAILNK